MGCLGDEVDRYPVQHIPGLGISERGHIVREALALQEALHSPHCELARHGFGQSFGKEKEVSGMGLLFIPTVLTGLNNTHALTSCLILSLQMDYLTEAKSLTQKSWLAREKQSNVSQTAFH